MISFTPDQRFIVTGASSGIGEGVALLLNELGATVIGIGRNQQRLDALKAKAKHPENMFLENKDLAENVNGLPAYVKGLKEKYGKFQGLAYCAGASSVTPLQALSLEEMTKIFTADCFAPVFMAKGIADKRNNIGKGTSCVFISSAAALRSDKGHCAYAGAKAALNASMKAVAHELAPQGIRLNCLLPTDIVTPMQAEFQEITESKKNHYPMGFGSVSDVANMVVFLLSDKAGWITGQNYVIDCASF